MAIEEQELPGVGTKFEIDIGADQQLVVIAHHNGKREIYRREQAEIDSEKLVGLAADKARTVGSILEGGHFQPVSSESVETMLAEESTLEWFDVAADAPLAGMTLGGAEVGEQTGVSVLAVKREGTTTPSPAADWEILAGDQVIVNGSKNQISQFASLVSAQDS